MWDTPVKTRFQNLKPSPVGSPIDIDSSPALMSSACAGLLF